MKILSIDSSTPQGCSVALLENKNILSQNITVTETARSGHILSMIDELLNYSGLHEVDGFVVTTGPGSFTGLRVGVSLIKGFVLASEKPFVGINTLEALAATVEPTPHPICSILDAKKNEVYAALFKYRDGHLARLSDDCVVPLKTLFDMISEPTVFVGSGVDTYGEALATGLGTKYIAHPKTKNPTTAASAALLAYDLFDSKKSFDLSSLTINYIRKSEAEIKLGN